MTRLTVSHIPGEVLSKLNANKILTLNDFLNADLDKLITYTQLQLKDLLSLKRKLTTVKVDNGYRFFKEFALERGLIKTCIKGLDNLLGGGLRPGTLLEICGASGSGKTQLVMNILANISVDLKIETFYIDTKGDFSATHFASLLGQKITEPEEVDEVLNTVKVQKVLDIYTLISTLTNLKKLYAESACTKKKVIVIDSITVPYFPFIGQFNREGLSILNYIASLLKYIANEYNVAILLTNLGAKNFESDDSTDHETSKSEAIECDIKPSLGKYWAHVPNTRLIITRISRTDITRRIKVAKSDVLKFNNTCAVDILKSGLFALCWNLEEKPQGTSALFVDTIYKRVCYAARIIKVDVITEFHHF